MPAVITCVRCAHGGGVTLWATFQWHCGSSFIWIRKNEYCLVDHLFLIYIIAGRTPATSSGNSESVVNRLRNIVQAKQRTSPLNNVGRGNRCRYTLAITHSEQKWHSDLFLAFSWLGRDCWTKQNSRPCKCDDRKEKEKNSMQDVSESRCHLASLTPNA